MAYSIRKEKKYYFWDWGLVEEPGARFENFMAVQLQRAVCAWNEWGKGVYTLYYLRDKQGREVDFAIADRQRVRILVEVKTTEENLSPSIPYYMDKTGAQRGLQVINKKGVCFQKSKNSWVVGIDRFLEMLV